jgi:hypothetical protein
MSEENFCTYYDEGKEVKHEILSIGHTFRYRDSKYHVIAVVDDANGNNEGILYVIKYYGKYKQWWHYEVWSAFEYDLRIRRIFD